MAYIKCENLAIGYDGKAVLEGVNFEVSEGDYLCIVGENGAGKSTLVKTLLHLLKPVAGTITFGDGLKDTSIGYLPQQTVVQKDFPASVKEIVLSGCQGKLGLRPFYGAKEKQTAMDNMRRMYVDSLANRCYRELSGGQQQRVLLARALCAADKMLLLDEPVSGLDPHVTSEMYELIRSLNLEGITIIMITHDIAAALKYATHILHIGSDVFFGTKEEYKESRIGKRFIGEESQNA